MALGILKKRGQLWQNGSSARLPVSSIDSDPETVSAGEPHQGDIYEYVFVIKGTLEVSIDGKTFLLNESESLKFEANQPHVYKCIGKEMAAAIMQLSYLAWDEKLRLSGMANIK